MTSDGFSSARIPPSLQMGCAGLALGGGSNGRRMVDVGGSVEGHRDRRRRKKQLQAHNIDVVAEDTLQPGARSRAGPRWLEGAAAVDVTRMLRRRMRRKKMQA
ncbi:hypothetical protein GW17_00061632 [Ensete ventricosum]|nr:hypothetical protein GW17_00061632 [Ensete ventricosum]